MITILIYFREVHLGENNKFTLDFSDKKFVQEIRKQILYYQLKL